jgi:serine/threonine-protein kinase
VRVTIRVPPPASLGKYRLVGVIGAGAMGVVYEAHDPGIDRLVALKTIRKDLLSMDVAGEVVARFRHEAMAAGRLSHPGIVAVYDYGEEGDTAYIVMEYAPGVDLSEYVRRRGALGLHEIASLMNQLLEALAYAHGQGVVHRDIKPSNLRISDDGRTKITDFGVARIRSSRLTQTGMPIGTPAYMAPEIYRGESHDHRADLFSAGVMLYELLAGALPFQGDSIASLAYQICHAAHPPLAAKRPGLPPRLDDVIRRALAKHASDRYGSARMFGDDLLAAVSPVPGTAGTGARALGLAETQLGVGPPPRAPAKEIEPEELDGLTRALAAYVGPIARVLVKKALPLSLDMADLCRRLAEHITDDDDRRRWLEQFRHGR